MTVTDISSPLYGMTTAQLQAALADAQKAYAELRSGRKVVSISYAQGGGSRSATFQQADLAGLRLWIQDLQAALNPGLRINRRRFVRPVF
ncbi:gpW family head-tail joining protein [Paraburkholderia caballeronis]|uniref:GpW protein n=1 Tax=Paraburkholderia caballeronis TaxID=416943 RepID=A0A1H7TZD2_9BURK|nr:gpW family head-tail joining protein [Paraburkholderia caballeronis]PXW23399.1 gpW protein [Paraburkholderia caballeronis]PXW98392.1 gpW protein [Paraburkholderia caballeronis]RAJ95123.1 gpW protein [Paraburkholderia caballeronis]SEC55787.1 gpW protein [Paraburkholderia caballeronis]SEL89788.1 gpW protein [Paraburkholderia caballeronis]